MQATQHQVVLTFECVDEILKCDHECESYLETIWFFPVILLVISVALSFVLANLDKCWFSYTDFYANMLSAKPQCLNK